MGSRVWTGVYRLAGMSGYLQTVKIQYSDSVLTCTSTVQNSTISEFAFVCGVEGRGDSLFGIVYRGSASRKVCESLL